MTAKKLTGEGHPIVPSLSAPHAHLHSVLAQTLQIHPLDENAVKYGMQTSALPLVIEVNAQAHNGTLQLSIVNSGRLITKPRNGVPTSNGAGIGLDNVRQRLAQTFPTRHQFNVFERDGRVYAELEIDRA